MNRVGVALCMCALLSELSERAASAVDEYSSNASAEISPRSSSSFRRSGTFARRSSPVIGASPLCARFGSGDLFGSLLMLAPLIRLLRRQRVWDRPLRVTFRGHLFAGCRRVTPWRIAHTCDVLFRGATPRRDRCLAPTGTMPKSSAPAVAAAGTSRGGAGAGSSLTGGSTVTLGRIRSSQRGMYPAL